MRDRTVAEAYRKAPLRRADASVLADALLPRIVRRWIFSSSAPRQETATASSTSIEIACSGSEIRPSRSFENPARDRTEVLISKQNSAYPNSLRIE